jgi:phage portal protein BeeE
MPGILDRVNAQRRGQTQAVERKQFSEPSFWQLDAFRQALVGDSAADRERIENDFIGYAAGAGKANGIVFACCYARLRVFADGNFLWRKREDGQLSAFYDSPELAMLRRPWPGGTLTNLLSWMEVDATYAGNSFSTTCDDRGRFGNASRGGPNRRITRLRPDWVTLVIGSHSDDPYAIDARVVGLIYEPPLSRFGGAHGKPVVLMPDEVCHYAPVPDPVARFRGMSWLTPVLREVSSDLAATDHKLKRWENGAALQTVVSLDKDISPDAFKQFVAMFRTTHEGVENAYKTLFLGGGADVNVVGADMQKMDFKALTGAGETRIAAAAGVHPVVVGLSESLAGSSLNAGNYNAARRNVSDGTLNHLWSEAASSLESLFARPDANAELCIDKRDIAFVREDAKDIAEIQSTRATALKMLLDAGWEPDAAVKYLASDDLTLLVGKHSGLFSVQLQPPGTVAGPAADPQADPGADPNADPGTEPPNPDPGPGGDQ